MTELRKRRYATADVFTDQMFGGNPVAVVLDAEGLSTSQMQAIALEFNYSETTFVLPARAATHTAQIRIFTPRAEVPFAGHPNIGTAFLLAHEPQFQAAAMTGGFLFEEAAGLVPLTLTTSGGRIIGAELRAPEKLTIRSRVSTDEAAACLSLSAREIAPLNHPPQVISVGLPFLVVELSSRAALQRAQPSLSVFSKILPLDGADAVFAYAVGEAKEHSQHQTVLHARTFSPLDGIVEDPATGSAAAATAALLSTLSQESSAEHAWLIHQGVDMGRPSVLAARTVRVDGVLAAVYIAGGCVPVMSGTFVAALDI